MTTTSIIIKKTVSTLMGIIMLMTIYNIHTYATEDKTADLSSIYVLASETNENTKINIQTIKDENYLVLPSAVSPSSVTLYADFPCSDIKISGEKKEAEFLSGNTIDMTEFCVGNDFKLTFSKDNDDRLPYAVKFLFSENIPSVYLQSDDPVLKGREWVESSVDKSNKATGTLVMLENDGIVSYNGHLTQIKGRGNSTWGLPKKPYQIKTEESVDLLKTDNPNNKSKTWVLLANYFDPTLLRNSLALGLGKSLGMETNIEGTYVDLYYDGEYRGNYMLTEKVETKKGRVEVDDLEKMNQEANPDKILEELPVKTATSPLGVTYTYCDGMVSPKDITGGYLLEMDYEARALEEVCYFKTTRGQYVVVKSPEFASKEEMEYISALYQEYEDAVYNNGINEKTNKSYSDYVDPESIACYYLVNEFSKSRDCFSSSAYLYKRSGEEKMHMGPLWDYDLSFGTSNYETHEEESPYGISPYNTDFSKKLIKIDAFYELVQTIYKEKMVPLMKEYIKDEENVSTAQSSLSSLAYMSDMLKSSAKNNTILWYDNTDLDKETEKLRNFISNRLVALDEIIFDLLPNGLKDNRFWDVWQSSWYYEEVSKACALGYMHGHDDGFFKPDDNVTRAQTAQVIYNMNTTDYKYSPNDRYSDVADDSWYAPAVSWATDTDVMDGFSDGNFLPQQYVTREELASYLYRFAKRPEIKSNLIENYKDAYLVASDKKDALEWAIAQEILKGNGDMLYPCEHLTRAELAAILLRYNEGMAQ